MSDLAKRYDPSANEARWRQYWEEKGINRYREGERGVTFSIDTPPPTVSGNLHMGHCYSYSQTDFYARYRRMRGDDVFYPMGWDDNGLPTERLVEKRLGITPQSAGSLAFIQAIMQTSGELEADYQQLWQRLGLSVDWRYTYSTISPAARRIAQYSFIDLYRKGRIYRSSAPTIWCPQCRTAIAHAEVSDLNRRTEFYTLAFQLEDGKTLPIATTRPELLAACVAVFVNPLDARFRPLIGQRVKSPLYEKTVEILADSKVEMDKGTGAVMCCTFGDSTDIKWWREHKLPFVIILEADGRLNQKSGILAGLDITSARRKIVEELSNRSLIMERKPASQVVSVHERCETTIEYLETQQWFIKVLDQKESLLKAGSLIDWHPGYMQARYEDWVQHLEWDWCISRQRYHGVPFPLWYCTSCEEIMLSDSANLPVDPRIQAPQIACRCGAHEFRAETSVMDTWATSSVSPQVAGGWLENPGLFARVFPMSLRPQAHDIIRTWTFYTIVKSLYHSGQVPWKHIAISGHGLSPDGHKVSKSKGNNLIDPLQVMQKYSADAVRYWAASSKLGEDSIIAEDKIASGQKLVNKLWSISTFAHPFLEGYQPPSISPSLFPADRWLLSLLQRLIQDVSQAFDGFDHGLAKNKIESFFWDILADNYLEMIKTRLYNLPNGSAEKEAGKYSLHTCLETVLKLLAPLMPFITEEIYQLRALSETGIESIHLSPWPQANMGMVDLPAESLGLALVEIATAARRYKSERKIPMGSPLAELKITASQKLIADLQNCLIDIASVTRAQKIGLSSEEGTLRVSILEQRTTE
jgi:valyl-tRNA synthetase